MKINKALVTGGVGFVGSHLVDELLSRGIETYVIDNLSTGSLENIKGHMNNKLFHLTIGDIRDISYLAPDISDMDVVFHEAAFVNDPKSIKNPVHVHEVNVNNTFELMNYCLKKDVKKFIFASSAAVYGESNNSISLEKSELKPITPYGASKAIIEIYLNTYWKTYGFKNTILRYFNIFGPRQRYDSESGVITIFFEKLLKNESPVVFGDGKQTRDFVNVKDIVQANMLVAESNNSFGEVFNVGTGKSTSILELAETMSKVAGKDIHPIFAEARRGDSSFSKASIDKIKKMLGYEPKILLEDGLKDMVYAKLMV